MSCITKTSTQQWGGDKSKVKFICEEMHTRKIEIVALCTINGEKDVCFETTAKMLLLPANSYVKNVFKMTKVKVGLYSL